jgi:hypothetical protein
MPAEESSGDMACAPPELDASGFMGLDVGGVGRSRHYRGKSMVKIQANRIAHRMCLMEQQAAKRK